MNKNMNKNKNKYRIKNKNKYKIKYILVLCIACLLIGCTSKDNTGNMEVIDIDINNTDNSAPALTDSELRQLKTSYIQTILNDNIKKHSAVADDIALLGELDPEAAVRWEMIVNYWNEANEDNFVGTEILPDGLPDDDSLCLVVLGFQLNTDGSMRDELIGRLETALANLEKYPNAYVVVTGGGTASGNPSATEADCMAEWLIDNGIDSSRIIIENTSRTTVENAVFTYRILSSNYPSVDSVAIITSDYHITLGCVLFNAEFLLDDTTDINSMKIVGNAAYSCNRTAGFSMQSQADWLNNLYTYH